MCDKVFVVIDLEWNQPVPWLRVKTTAQKLPGEIIEIGAVKVIKDHDKYCLSEPFQRTVRPRTYTIMNKNVGRVINKKSADLKNGLPFSQAYSEFLDWCDSDALVLCAWGNSDIDILKSNLRFHNLDDRLGMEFLDVQPLFSKRTGHGSEQKSVEYALDFLEIHHDNTFHEAHSDAYNTGVILQALFSGKDDNKLREELVDYIYNPDTATKTIENTSSYVDVSSCFLKNKIREVFCPVCKSKTIDCLTWFRMKNAAFYLGRCECHGYISSRMRMKRDTKNHVFATIITKRIYPGEAEMLYVRHSKHISANLTAENVQ